MEITTIVTTVSVSTAIAVVVVVAILYGLHKANLKALCGRICCVSCSGANCPTTTSPGRPDFIYREDANCQLDVAVVFIDRNDYQQVYLSNMQGRHVYSTPSAPPPPYEVV